MSDQRGTCLVEKPAKSGLCLQQPLNLILQLLNLILQLLNLIINVVINVVIRVY